MKHRIARWADRNLFDDEHLVEDAEDAFRPFVAACLAAIVVVVVIVAIGFFATRTAG